MRPDYRRTTEEKPPARVRPAGQRPLWPSGVEAAEPKHQNHGNAARALATLIEERNLPAEPGELLGWAYRIGREADPWRGYLTIKAETERELGRDPRAVLLHRLQQAQLRLPPRMRMASSA